MCNTPVLAVPIFSKTFVFECDALEKGLGVALMQEGHPLAFTNKQSRDNCFLKSTYKK